MTKTIWTCWFQGRENAPPLIEACLRSWERENPGWVVRCLDAQSIQRYVSLGDFVDLERSVVTAASLSDIVRIVLLREFGGVWVDATLWCNRPLDEWLSPLTEQGFFAFAEPAAGRPLSSWFLSAEPGCYLISAWCRAIAEYWSQRAASDDYFWLHHLFRDLCAADPVAAAAWSRVPRVSAAAPHELQVRDRLYRPAGEVAATVDWTTPVFKLTHRLDDDRIEPGSMVARLLERSEADAPALEAGAAPRSAGVTRFASLKVSTENAGDHIQIIAGLRLLSRLGIEPDLFIDRDDGLASGIGLPDGDDPVGILLNGWFKSNRTEWPPHPRLVPVIDGFHIRLFQCPELVSPASIAFFRRNEPVGCRDPSTETLLQLHGVDAFISNCLSLTFAARIERPETQTETFVVSRDERVTSLLPPTLAGYTFLSHYTGSADFAANVARAHELLDLYRTRAKLIVTTLLHCALPAIAMGIPVVVFYPLNDEFGHASDVERFSALEGIVRAYRFDEMKSVDWAPQPVDVSELKLRLFERFYELAARWGNLHAPPLGPIAPTGALLPP